MVGRGQRLADHAFQAVDQAGGLHVSRAAGVPRRGPDEPALQAELLEPLPPPGVEQPQQQLTAALQHVEQVQLYRDVADQAAGRTVDMYPGLHQAEVRVAAADRDDLPVHDHRDADPLRAAARTRS